MTRVPGHEALYVVTDALRDRCLVQDDSLFSPGQAIWTADAAEQIAGAVAEDDTSKREFADKLSHHLAYLSPDAKQLGAEILYLVLLPESDTGEARKMKHIERVLALLPIEVVLPDQLKEALRYGFAKYGQGGRAHRHEAVRYLARFTRAWKRLAGDSRTRRLEDPWAFQEFVATVESDRADTERSALLHLAFPDTFEPIVSRNIKEKIVYTFSEHVGNAAAPLDQRLGEIRIALEPEYGPGFDYWEPELKAIWNPDDRGEAPDSSESRRLGQDAVEAAIRALAATRLKTQTDSMLRVFLAFKAIHRDELVSSVTGREIESIVKELFTVIPTPPGTPDAMVKGTISLRGKNGAPAWLSNDSHRGSFMDYAGPTSLGRIMFLDEDWRLPMRDNALERVVSTLGAGQYDWPPAQALAAIALRNEQLLPNLDWADMEDLARARFGVTGEEWEAITSAIPLGIHPLTGPAWDPSQLSSELRPPGVQDAEKAEREIEGLPTRLAQEVTRVLEALRAHGQRAIVALVGVPGTSKSHVARLAARAFASDNCLREIQFSPGYTYEEFMEGPRYGEEMRVGIMPGAFLELNWRALKDPASQYVLLIEELTRADLPRVLGELLTFIEYRDEADLFSTLYTREDVTRIAPNLAILATYNPMDRSAISVDAALVRRMRILDFPPDTALLREISAENGVEDHVIDSLVGIFDACRQIAGERFSETMPFGHAMFASVTSETDLYHLWHQTIKHILVRPHASRHELYPTIEQYYPWRQSPSYTVVPVSVADEQGADAQVSDPRDEGTRAEVGDVEEGGT